LSGYNPAAGMAIDGSGNLYGTTSIGGGSSGLGTAFELSHSGSGWNLTALHVFNWNNSELAGDGADPHAAVVIGPDGSLYGTTCCGGLPASGGTVYKLTQANGAWKETILYRFSLGANGGNPQSAVTFDQSGNLYGTTPAGGRLNQGTVYKLSPGNGGQWRETVLWNFGTLSNDGLNPFGNVVLDRSGNIYGTAETGGAHRNGTVFELVPSGSGWTEKILYSFTGATDGGFPVAGLISDQAGNLYGATSLGGSGGGGTVFELTPSGSNWEFHVLYGLPGPGGQTGPFANVALDHTGNIYGTTYADGANRLGSVFKLAPSGGSWVYTDLHDFNGTDGEYPESNITVDSSGNLYGTTVGGGTGTGCNTTCGVAFEITAH
jgi:uncharacterized repeat protein (TIGR03803 family)